MMITDQRFCCVMCGGKLDVFKTTSSYLQVELCPRCSKRDERRFTAAIAAIQGFIVWDRKNNMDSKLTAAYAVDYADALLAELAKTKEATNVNA